jgi:hypothetical protein
MAFGSKPTDGGFLNMTREERDRLLQTEPEAERFIKRYMGASELLRGGERYCLWITDEEACLAAAVPEIRRRMDQVAAFRMRSSTTAQAMADRPYRFLQRAHRDTSAIVVPSVSSERRAYVPMGFVGSETVISNAANAIYGAEPWLFALLQSRMHMTWVRAVGGRMKTDIRYSAVLVYNTFPVPELSGTQRSRLTDAAVAVLAGREQFAGQTLAELYDPDKMPPVLRSAHQELDDAVDALYQSKPFDSDAARLELLFDMYEAATTEAPVTADA